MNTPMSWRQATTVADAIDMIRRTATSSADIGREFEDLFSLVADNMPEFEARHVYRLAEWPDVSKYGLDGRDIGVDRVVELTNGDVVAVQCKCYEHEHKVSKADIQKFLSGSQNDAFALRWLVTTSDLSDTAHRMLKNTNVRHIDFYQYGDAHLDDMRHKSDRQPFPLQQEAINNVLEGFANPDSNGRGQLIMACGTGKTFTALRIAEQLVASGGRIIFLAPSIALVAQARREWLTYTARSLRCMVVCSDATVARGEKITIQELSFAVTTDSIKIANTLRDDVRDGVSVVFCTYQSLPRVIEAQKKYGAPAFDLALVDEAHRTAGIQDNDRERRVFQLIHDQDEIRCDKRLYMTATPRVYSELAKANRMAKKPDITITDMNDTQIYGRRFYRLAFREAVDNDMLCDVRVICLGLSEAVLGEDLAEELKDISNQTPGHGKPPDTQEYMSALVIGLALHGWVEGKRMELPPRLPRTLAYANTIRRSKWLEQALQSSAVSNFLRAYRQNTSRNGNALKNGAPAIEAVHLDAHSPAHERCMRIRELNAAGVENKCRVITNCRLFSEGVDVPALNSVAFLDPKSSTADIIQSIGRVMRKSSDKKLGYIIAPFSLPKGASIATELENKSPRFEILGKVLRALQSHDEELYAKLGNVVIADYAGADTADDSEWSGEGQGGASADEEDDQRTIDRQISLFLDNAKSLYAMLANYSGIGNRGIFVADIIIATVQRVARIFADEGIADTLSRALGISNEMLDNLPEDEQVNKAREACHTAALIICNACLMHKRLEAAGITDGLTRLDEMGSKADIITTLINDWHTILRQDYKPIFSQALAALFQVRDEHPNKVQVQDALHILINCAVDTSESLSELGYDHAGPLYHRILEHASSQGAFYTKNISALLMSGLVFDDEMIDWSNPQQVRDVRVIDPCCGTGTLLMAALNTIKNKARAAGHLSQDEQVALHKSLVENSIYGFDITHYAAQLAACNLTLGAPDVSYSRMNIYTLEYGMASAGSAPTVQHVRHGALELLLQMDFKNTNAQRALDMNNLVPPVAAMGLDTRSSAELQAPNKFNVVMMNPPFTNTRRLNEQFPQAVASAMTKRLKTIAAHLHEQSPDARRALAKMSVQPFFTPLGEQLVAEGGTLAKFVPTTFCTANNSIGQRRYLADCFHIDIVVTIHHPKYFSFSASTDIHESLLIARRTAAQDKPTRFIQLARPPRDSQETAELVGAIRAGELGNWGTMTLWPAERVRAGNWTPVQWYATELAEAAQMMSELDRLEISDRMYNWSPGSREIIGNFNYTPRASGDNNETNAYCTISPHQHYRMASPPDTWAVAKPNKSKRAHQLLKRGGHVLVPSRVDTTNARVIALYSEVPSVGSAYRPIDSATKIPQPIAKAYTLFLNSIFGVLQFLNIRTKKLTYPAYEAGLLRTLLLPSSGQAALQPLIDLFDKVSQQDMPPIWQSHQSSVCREIDYAVADLLHVPRQQTDRWRVLLAHEPTICNKEKTSD